MVYEICMKYAKKTKCCRDKQRYSEGSGIRNISHAMGLEMGGIGSTHRASLVLYKLDKMRHFQLIRASDILHGQGQQLRGILPEISNIQKIEYNFIQ